MKKRREGEPCVMTTGGSYSGNSGYPPDDDSFFWALILFLVLFTGVVIWHIAQHFMNIKPSPAGPAGHLFPGGPGTIPEKRKRSMKERMLPFLRRPLLKIHDPLRIYIPSNAHGEETYRAEVRDINRNEISIQAPHS